MFNSIAQNTRLRAGALGCDHCRGKVGFRVHRYWHMRFCCTACMGAYRQRLSSETKRKNIPARRLSPVIEIGNLNVHSTARGIPPDKPSRRPRTGARMNRLYLRADSRGLTTPQVSNAIIGEVLGPFRRDHIRTASRALSF